MLFVEAKKDDFDAAWGQCLAAMIAAQRLNDRPACVVHGGVSNGRVWYFGKLAETRSSVSPYVQASFEASLIPAIYSIRSLGIVWIPGLMAGMLLSGAKPVYAAIYQFVVLAMIFTASGLTALASTVLIRGRVFSPAEQLLLQPGR